MFLTAQLVFSQTDIFSFYGPFDAETYTNLKSALKNPEQVYKLKLVHQYPEKDIKKIENFTHLQVLELSSNTLETLPPEIGSLTNLLALKIVEPVSKLPKEIGNLKNLMYLELVNTNLDSLPVEIGFFSKIRKLKIKNNRNNKGLNIPYSIKYLHKLKELTIIQTPLDTLPKTFCDLKSLKHLTLADCNLYTLPDCIGSIKTLESLILDVNHLQYLPESIFHLSGLYYLSLYNNQFTQISENISSLKNLEELNIQGNPVSNYQYDILKILLPNTKIVFK